MQVDTMEWVKATVSDTDPMLFVLCHDAYETFWIACNVAIG